MALEVAIRSPERVDRMVLLTPSLAWRRFRVAARLVRLLRPELGALPTPMLHAASSLSIRNMFARPNRVPPAAMNGAADEFVRYFATPRGRIAFFNAAREIYLEDPHGRRGFWTRLSRPCPSRRCSCSARRTTSYPTGSSATCSAAAPHAEFELLADCGHVPQFELPDATNALVRRFLLGSAART